MSEMLFKTADRLHLADLVAVCEFSTEFSLGLSLRQPGENEGVEIGWMDLHLTKNGANHKIYFRLCLHVELTTRNRIDCLRQDCYRALAIPDSAYYEIRLFCPEKSVLMLDAREGFFVSSGFTVPPETPLLDYHFAAPPRDEQSCPREPQAGSVSHGEPLPPAR